MCLATNHNDVNIIIMCNHNVVQGEWESKRMRGSGDATDMEHDTEEGPEGKPQTEKKNLEWIP